LKGIYKRYAGGVEAVKDFNIDIADKDFIILLGPSGCGKSTTLRMIAGLEEITEGELYIGEKLMNDVAPKDRDIAMVFQNYALYPHMTVYENMAFALKLRKVPKAEIDKKVKESAEILGITEYLNRRPKALSGGQRQRVAIGRAIVREPQVFLMDEPLSNLDAKLRNQMRAELIKLRERIDTNGSLPATVNDMLNAGIIDYVALDYKAPWSRYREIAGKNADPERVKQTLKLWAVLYNPILLH
jgi:multiple sugar transport system ATP-binding protein